MKIIRTARAGSTAPSDMLVEIAPGTQGIELILTGKSAVMKLFRPQMERVIRETLAELGVCDAIVSAQDSGALDCVIRGRTICAARRAAQEALEEMLDVPVGAMPQGNVLMAGANDAKMLLDAPLYGKDAIVFDLTAAGEADAARILLAEALGFYDYPQPVWIAVHEGDEGKKDMAALVKFGHGFVYKGGVI